MEVNLENFDWGITDDWFRNTITKEFETKNIYFKFFDVEENDVVLDFGASIGPFGYLIKDKNIEHLYGFEPSIHLLPTLYKNISTIPNTIIPYAIGEKNKFIELEHRNVYFTSMNILPCITFNQFIEDFQIKKIDFLKTDCEGGEYHIFNEFNVSWIKENVRKIVGEWHLSTMEQKEQFRKFRDTYLSYFKNTNVYSVDGIDIKWDLWNEHFLEYYNEVIIYIDNR